MFCYKCGTQLPDDAAFCVKCGAKMTPDQPGPEPSAPEAPPPAPAPAPPPAPKKTNRALPIILIAVGAAVVIALIVGGIFAWKSGLFGAGGPAADSSARGDSDEVQLGGRYRDREMGFSFRYPDSWEEFNGNAGAGLDPLVWLVDRSGVINASLLIAATDYDPHVMDYTEREIYEIFSQDNDNVTGVTLERTRIGGTPCLKIIWSYTNEKGIWITSDEYMYNNGDRCYVLALAAMKDLYEEYAPVFQAIVDSYRVTEPERRESQTPESQAPERLPSGDEPAQLPTSAPSGDEPAQYPTAAPEAQPVEPAGPTTSIPSVVYQDGWEAWGDMEYCPHVTFYENGGCVFYNNFGGGVENIPGTYRVIIGVFERIEIDLANGYRMVLDTAGTGGERYMVELADDFPGLTFDSSTFSRRDDPMIMVPMQWEN